jgi:hypothetical protein
LDRPSIDPIVGELENGAVSQHMWVNREANLRRLAQPSYHLSETGCGERRPAL